MAIVQIRHDTEGRAYFQRRVAAGKTKMEALRALKRRLSDVVYRQLATDMKKTSPGEHTEATTTSSAADPAPTVSSSEQSQPGLTAEPTPLAHDYHDTADVDNPTAPHPAPPAPPTDSEHPDLAHKPAIQATSYRPTPSETVIDIEGSQIRPVDAGRTAAVRVRGRLGCAAERTRSCGELVDLGRGDPGDETHDVGRLGRGWLAEVLV
jgi:hypothetical protein